MRVRINLEPDLEPFRPRPLDASSSLFSAARLPVIPCEVILRDPPSTPLIRRTVKTHHHDLLRTQAVVLQDYHHPSTKPCTGVRSRLKPTDPAQVPGVPPATGLEQSLADLCRPRRPSDLIEHPPPSTPLLAFRPFGVTSHRKEEGALLLRAATCLPHLPQRGRIFRVCENPGQFHLIFSPSPDISRIQSQRTLGRCPVDPS